MQTHQVWCRSKLDRLCCSHRKHPTQKSCFCDQTSALQAHL